MKKIILLTMIFLSIASTALAVDEATYVQFTADSIIAANDFKGNPNAADLWMQEMQARYPNFMDEDWEAFERRIQQDSALKDRVTNAVLQHITSQGYNASIVNLGGGATTVEIMD